MQLIFLLTHWKKVCLLNVTGSDFFILFLIMCPLGCHIGEINNQQKRVLRNKPCNELGMVQTNANLQYGMSVFL